MVHLLCIIPLTCNSGAWQYALRTNASFCILRTLLYYHLMRCKDSNLNLHTSSMALLSWVITPLVDTSLQQFYAQLLFVVKLSHWANNASTNNIMYTLPITYLADKFSPADNGTLIVYWKSVRKTNYIILFEFLIRQ